MRSLVADVAGALGISADVAIEIWSERAAIREYLGEMPRGEAERAAMIDLNAILANFADGAP